MKEENRINIYADWIQNENQIGTLYVSSMRGKTFIHLNTQKIGYTIFHISC